MKDIGPNEVIEIRRKYMLQNKIPLKIYFPVSKYNCEKIWQSESAIPCKIFGIEIRECLDRETIEVVYKTIEKYYE